MEGERKKDRDTAKENPVGQDSPKNEYGEIGGEVDQPGSYAGGVSGRQSTTEGEGFILKEDMDEQDFARGGQGAIENTEPSGSDVERDTDRDEKSDSNIEGSVG